MKNLFLSITLVPLILLTACGKPKKVVVVEEQQPAKECRIERISGPLSDKEVAWEEEDLK